MIQEVNLKTPRDLASFVDLNEQGSRGQKESGASVGRIGCPRRKDRCGVPLSEVCVFQLAHSGVYCPISQRDDVMFHRRL